MMTSRFGFSALTCLLALGLALGPTLPAPDAWAQGKQKSGYAGDTVVLQGGGGEYFIGGLPPGWQAGGADDTEAGHHRQWIPNGQAQDNWSDIIAYQLFPPFKNMPAKQFLTQMAKFYGDHCDQVLATEITPSDNANGFDDATQILACTHNKDTDVGEVTLFRAVNGAGALYVIQRGWRLQPFPPEKIPITGAQLEDATKVVGFGHACKLSDSTRPCPQGWQSVLAGLDKNAPAVIFPATN